MSNDAYIPVEAEGRVKSVNDAILEQETVIEVKGPFVKAPPAPKFSKRVKAEAGELIDTCIGDSSEVKRCIHCLTFFHGINLYIRLTSVFAY